MNTLNAQALETIMPSAIVSREGTIATIIIKGYLPEVLGVLFGEPHFLSNGDLLYASDSSNAACVLSSKTLRSCSDRASFTVTESHSAFGYAASFNSSLRPECEMSALHQAM